MIAEEAYWLEEECLHAFCRDRFERLLDRGANPRASTGALALKGKPPARNLRNARRNQFGSATRLFRIRVGALATRP
jgi:hypothetical protein